MEKQIIIEKEIGKLPKKKQDKILFEYERRKLNMWSARALWFFWFHYLHTNKVWLWFLYLVSCFLYVWIVRRIVQAFMLKDEINKKNKEILEMIYRENA